MRLAGEHPIRVALLGAGLTCALVLPASAEARIAEGNGALSPRLAELARPAVRSASHARQARHLEIAASGPGSLVREGGRVVVEARFEGGVLAHLDGLRAAGARVLGANRGLQTATLSVSPGELHGVAGVGGLDEVREVRAPLLYGGGGLAAGAVGAECEGGSVISEGVAQLHADDARSLYGVDGEGVTVGVLSDSYNQATRSVEGGTLATRAPEDVASGDLPGAANPCAGQEAPVDVLSDDFKGAEGVAADDEGRAMLQIVHDVAPGASLAFATAFDGESSFAKNIEKLAKPTPTGAGAQVIADDVAYFEEPFFQDGPIANAVDKVASQGVTYFSAAGNDNLCEGGDEQTCEGSREIASWEAPSFRDSSTCPQALLKIADFGAGHCMDFNPSASETDDTFGIRVAAQATLTVDLQWAEPWGGVQTDLDAYLLSAGGELLASETSDNVKGGTERPVEVLQWENTGNSSKEVTLAVNKCFGEPCNKGASGASSPRLKLALLENGAGVTKTEYPVSHEGDIVGPTIFGHTGAAGAASVAAVPFDNSSAPEPYSSRGPVKHFFGPVNGNTAAAAIPEEVIEKPDIAATDCGATTFFAEFFSAESVWRFCGTSAATPHAAGVAALELQAKPSATPAEVRSAQTDTAVPVGGFGSEAVGAGLLEAAGAVADLLPPSPTTVTLTSHPASRTAQSSPIFEFEASPGPSSFSCSVDGLVTAEACSSPYQAPSLADGRHVFEVEALEGGTVVGSASFSFTVDTTAPTISFAGQPTSVSVAAPKLSFSASEPAAFACALDGGPAQSCASPFAVPAPLADGPHTLALTATDQAGNSATADLRFVVDTSAPTVVFEARPAADTRDPTPSFAFSASEPARLACSLDGGPPRPCENASFAVAAPLADGPHSLAVTATDLAGNVGGATAAFTVDTTPPQTRFSLRPPRNVRTRLARPRLVLRFAASEKGSSFRCRVDHARFHVCPGVFSRRFARGLHVVRVKAVDPAGNVDRSPAVFRFRVRRVGG